MRSNIYTLNIKRTGKGPINWERIIIKGRRTTKTRVEAKGRGKIFKEVDCFDNTHMEECEG